MGRKSRSKRRGKASPLMQHALRTSPNWPLLVLSGIGILLTGYLAWTSFMGAAVKGCAAGGGCDVVLTSRWATLFGLPTAFWGLMAYAGIGGIAFVRRVDQHWSYAFSAAFFGFCYSVYLTTVSLLILEAACPYCLTSLTLMAATLALVIYQRPREMVNRPWRGLLLGRGVLASLVIVSLHLNYTAPLPEPLGPEAPMAQALAVHLTETGVKFYGASWCPHCQEQKRLFGPSASRLPYVECSPNGRNRPGAAICGAIGIRTYPTWIINGQWITNVLTLEQLANATGFVMNTSSGQRSPPATTTP